MAVDKSEAIDNKIRTDIVVNGIDVFKLCYLNDVIHVEMQN